MDCERFIAKTEALACRARDLWALRSGSRQNHAKCGAAIADQDVRCTNIPEKYLR